MKACSYAASVFVFSMMTLCSGFAFVVVYGSVFFGMDIDPDIQRLFTDVLYMLLYMMAVIFVTSFLFMLTPGTYADKSVPPAGVLCLFLLFLAFNPLILFSFQALLYVPCGLVYVIMARWGAHAGHSVYTKIIRPQKTEPTGEADDASSDEELQTPETV